MFTFSFAWPLPQTYSAWKSHFCTYVLHAASTTKSLFGSIVVPGIVINSIYYPHYRPYI